MIVSEVGGLQRLVDGGTDGLFFESGDADGLAAQMRSVMGADVARELAAAGREKMLASYTWKKVSSDLEAIYAGAGAGG